MRSNKRPKFKERFHFKRCVPQATTEVMRKNILVVGGAGYVGSHTVKLLKNQGYHPVVLDDLSTGHKKAVCTDKFYQGSVCNQSLVEKIIRTEKISTVMHFSAKALVGESIQNPLLYYQHNISHTLALLAVMQKCNVINFVFSSSCSTFGEPSKSPISENTPQNPINPYGQSKLFVERILKDLAIRQDSPIKGAPTAGINSAILRYFNAAGADPDGELGEDHSPETHLIPNILKAALGHEKKLVVNGNDFSTPDGTCIRDYVHVRDLALAHIQAMEYIWKKKTICDFNLGSEKGYSILEILKAAEQVVHKKILYKVGPRRLGDPAILVANSKKARKILNWKPKYSLKDIIATTSRWMQKHPHGYNGS